MYTYSYDKESGGLLLNATPSAFSKEPRPVYSRELDILGFSEIWKYDRQDDSPYMWAEANFYWYRGIRVAHTSGGSLYEKPAIVLEKDEADKPILPPDSVLKPVDIPLMVQKNHDMLQCLENYTVKKIYEVYQRYKDKLDCFHVAFSGGKDSIVLLELVKRALPRTAFIVVFGDTGMEFPDTYDTVAKIEEQCRNDGIAFYRAKSHFSPEESWKLFGPPSRVLRWCCTVHKSVPQTIKIREILGKKDYTELAFVGVRSYESISRSNYDYEINDHKVKGQRSFNAILEWSSAEIWLYIYANNLPINTAYLIGNQRVGCVYCPMSLKTDYLKKYCYPDIIEKYEKILLMHYSQDDISNGYWCARSNGTQLAENEANIQIINSDKTIEIEVNKPKTDVNEWLKTIGNENVQYTIKYNENGYTLSIPSPKNKEELVVTSLIKIAARKSAYCIACGACEANCRNGCISFKNGLHIDGCKHCQACNQLLDGCLNYGTHKFPTHRGEMNMKTNVDVFGSHAPKTSWLEDFFKDGNSFLKENSLGPEQKTRFRRFLRAAGLIDNHGTTSFSGIIEKLGWKSEPATGLILANLAYNPQIRWYIKNLPQDKTMSRQEVIALLTDQGYSQITSKFVVSAFRRICDIPLGTSLHFGEYTEHGKSLESITRTKTALQDPLVVLYSLYRFAEACEGYYEFSLSRLMDFHIESVGISPAEIFGFTREEMERILSGLSYSQPDFINFSTTYGLDAIRLSDDHKSSDVLALFNASLA